MKHIYYKSGYKYQLHLTFICMTGILPDKEVGNKFVRLHPDGRLVIYDGYAWDGPSGPCPDWKSTMRGSLVHDALYQLMRLEAVNRKHRDTADRLLQSMCRDDGMPRPLAAVIYNAVKYGAEWATHSKYENKIRTAP